MRASLLEINVSRRDEMTCAVELRYERPDDPLLDKRSSANVPLDLALLRDCRNDREAYGRALVNGLLASNEVGDALRDSIRDGLANYDGLRVRLHVDTASTPLHTVRWETLADPLDTSRWLLTNERILFSR